MELEIAYSVASVFFGRKTKLSLYAKPFGWSPDWRTVSHVSRGWKYRMFVDLITDLTCTHRKIAGDMNDQNAGSWNQLNVHRLDRTLHHGEGL